MPLHTISVSSNGSEDIGCNGDGLAVRHADGKRSANVLPVVQVQAETRLDVPEGEVQENGKADAVREASPYSQEHCTNDKSTPEPSIAESQSDSYSSFSGDICRICHSGSSAEEPLIEPCVCSGSLRFVHLKCLQQWIKSVDTKTCELCKFNFVMTSKVKPFRTWQKLDMSSLERRKVLCSVAFHVIAITCVVWSLYVLIDRTTEEVNAGNLEWPFWTKLIVVAIGFTGGLVFMYVQCKMYIQLCKRWRAYNRIIYIQDCPPEAGQEMRTFKSTQQARPPVAEIETELF